MATPESARTSEEPAKPRPAPSPEVLAWWAKESLIWQRQYDILHTPGVSAFGIEPNLGPVTIGLDPTVKMSETRAAVRKLLEELGLMPGDYRFHAHLPVWKKDNGSTETPKSQ